MARAERAERDAPPPDAAERDTKAAKSVHERDAPLQLSMAAAEVAAGGQEARERKRARDSALFEHDDSAAQVPQRNGTAEDNGPRKRSKVTLHRHYYRARCACLACSARLHALNVCL